MRPIWMVLLLVVVFALSACGGQTAETSYPVENVTPMETARSFGPNYTNVVSNGAVTFMDSISGISLEYPKGWIMDQVRGGSRSPTMFLFTNYPAIPSLMDIIGPEDTIVHLIIPQPGLQGTLIGLIDSYRQAWAEEGSSIVNEQDVTLNSGEPGKVFILDSYLERQYYYLFTQIDGTLVFIEAYGVLEPVAAIALSIR